LSICFITVSPYVLGNTDKFDFLREHLQINTEKHPFIEGDLDDIQFTKSFSLDNERKLNLIVSTGVDKKTKEDIIEWHTFITNKKRLSWEELNCWAKNAHEICSNTFKNMISSELYEYFSR